MSIRRIALSFLLIVLLGISRPERWHSKVEGVVSGGETLILPQMFNVSNGGSTVVLQNLSGSAQDINVEFFAQNGDFVDFITRSVPAMGEAQVPTPAGPGGEFIGSALILANDPFTARGQWDFNVGAMPLAVGVPTLANSEAATTFQVPVGTVGANSMVGVAIMDPVGLGASCTVTYRDTSGAAVAEDAYTIPGFGQISEFAGGIGAGFEGTATIQCNNATAAMSVIQEQTNGFPTPLFACPVP